MGRSSLSSTTRAHHNRFDVPPSNGGLRYDTALGSRALVDVGNSSRARRLFRCTEKGRYRYSADGNHLKLCASACVRKDLVIGTHIIYRKIICYVLKPAFNPCVPLRARPLETGGHPFHRDWRARYSTRPSDNKQALLAIWRAVRISNTSDGTSSVRTYSSDRPFPGNAHPQRPAISADLVSLREQLSSPAQRLHSMERSRELETKTHLCFQPTTSLLHYPLTTHGLRTFE